MLQKSQSSPYLLMENKVRGVIEPRVAYVKRCDLIGCLGPCDDFHASCERIPVLIIPVYDEEIENRDVSISLSFGNTSHIAPWTKRQIKSAICPLEHPGGVMNIGG